MLRLCRDQSEIACRVRTLLGAFALLSASVSVYGVNAGGPMLAGLTHKHQNRDLDGMSVEVHMWTGPRSQFVLRTLRLTQQDQELSGAPGLGVEELQSIAKSLAQSDAVNAGDDVSFDGPHGNFRTRTFEATKNRHCVALRSFDGRNQSNQDQYEYFNGTGGPMGTERVDAAYCRLGSALTASEIRTLVDGIK
jgi:hypothetical protein